MARGPYEERTRVYWVPSLANKAAPTVAELNAGTDLSCFLTKDGLTEPSGQNMTPAAALPPRAVPRRVPRLPRRAAGRDLRPRLQRRCANATTPSASGRPAGRSR